MIDTDIFDDVDQPIRGQSRPDAPASVIDTDIQPPAAVTKIPLDIRRLINTARGEEIFKIEDGETETPPVIAAEITSEPGQKMPDGTIYLGRYSPVDRYGISLAKTFNVFAAPEDLPETMTYVDTVEYIASLKNWHGHDGANFANDKEFYAALKDGSYIGGWIIPTCDILYGRDNNDQETSPDNIFAHKDKGSFKDTFKVAADKDPDTNSWYWSSTDRYKKSQYVRNFNLSEGVYDWLHEDGARLNCRPVRLVEVKIGV